MKVTPEELATIKRLIAHLDTMLEHWNDGENEFTPATASAVWVARNVIARLVGEPLLVPVAEHQGTVN